MMPWVHIVFLIQKFDLKIPSSAGWFRDTNSELAWSIFPSVPPMIQNFSFLITVCGEKMRQWLKYPINEKSSILSTYCRGMCTLFQHVNYDIINIICSDTKPIIKKIKVHPILGEKGRDAFSNLCSSWHFSVEACKVYRAYNSRNFR